MDFVRITAPFQMAGDLCQERFLSALAVFVNGSPGAAGHCHVYQHGRLGWSRWKKARAANRPELHEGGTFL